MSGNPTESGDAPSGTPTRTPSPHSNMILLSMGGKPVGVDIGGILYEMHATLGRTKINTLIGAIHKFPYEQRADRFREILSPALNTEQIDRIMLRLHAHMHGSVAVLGSQNPFWGQPQGKYTPPIPWPTPKELDPNKPRPQ